MLLQDALLRVLLNVLHLLSYRYSRRSEKFIVHFNAICCNGNFCESSVRQKYALPVVWKTFTLPVNYDACSVL